jgi:hypothetical protein
LSIIPVGRVPLPIHELNKKTHCRAGRELTLCHRVTMRSFCASVMAV